MGDAADVLGGALGNLIDRLANGAVTDWVGISWYPATFNLADVAIRVGSWSPSWFGRYTTVGHDQRGAALT